MMRYRKTLVILLMALFASSIAGWGIWRTSSPEKKTAHTKTTPDKEENRRSGEQNPLQELYNSASEDIKSKNYASAAEKLRRIAATDPKFKDAAVKAETVQQLASETALSSTTGQPSPTEANPTTASTSSGSSDDDSSSPPGSSSEPSSPPPSQAGAGNPTPPTLTPKPKDVPIDATPFSILPAQIEGYTPVHKRWVTEPKEADAGYRPTDPAAAIELDFVVILAAKYGKDSDAENRLKEEKERFPESSQNITVNGHRAYFGTYNERRPDLYPALSSLMWVRDNWFLSVTVVPGSFPSTDYKREIAIGVAQQFGY